MVRCIYDMALEGYGLAEIATALGADGIVNPTYYWRSKGVNRSGSKSTLEPTKWGHTTVKKILTLQEYCGDVINFKSYSKSYKMKRRMVSELIDHIDVYHAEKQDGVTNQQVVIHYNCIGAFEVPDRKKIPEADIIMETRKGVTVSYAPAQIAV